jgi:hypothetical protein
MRKSRKTRTVLVGDVHGCLEELSALIEQLRVQDTDKLVFCGDLLDKGPHSAEVVKFVRELANHVPLVLVKGNHEEKHERFRKHEQSGKPNPIKNAGVFRAISEKLSSEDIEFLENAVLYHPLPEHGALVVHGGVPPRMRDLPALTGLRGQQKKRAEHMLRCRFTDQDGNLVLLTDYHPYRHTFWAETYDGRFGHVFFGHEPFTGVEPKRFLHATGLDTGCVFGGSLTAAVLEPGSTNPVFVTVEARQKYAEPLNLESLA